MEPRLSANVTAAVFCSGGKNGWKRSRGKKKIFGPGVRVDQLAGRMIRMGSHRKKSNNSEYAGSTKGFRITIAGLIKRTFDFTAALIGLILLAPFFALIAILIKRDSPGPAFYWGTRIGRYGVFFKMLKFRTMYERPECYNGLRITSKEDDRITPLGRWLRDTKLNEFPQLWNVLIGEMSLVGPRPEDPLICKTWPAQLANEILSVQPGITSPASVLYRDEENMLHAGDVMHKYLHELSPDKMRLDQLYIRYRSFWLDLDVIFWTMLLLVPKIRAYSLPEQLLFVGPVARLIQRYVAWFIWDFLIVFASMSLTGAVVRLFGPLNIGWLRAIEMTLGCSLLYTLAGLLLNTNRIYWRKATSWESGRLLAGWFIATIVLLSIHSYLRLSNLRTDGIILCTSMLSLFGIIVMRYRERLINGFLSRLLSRQPNTRAVRERVLIVGSGRTAEHIAWLMDHPTYSKKFQIFGFIDNDLLSQGMQIYGSKVIGMVEDIHTIVKKHDIGLIILADNQTTSSKYTQFHNIDSFNPARIVVAPDIFGSLSGLDGTSTNTEANDNLNNFQCQYCLARYAIQQGRIQEIHAYNFETGPLEKGLSTQGDRKK
jgi:lipopolysaccharide/colanic/teichoic acid biosynthesis glycosyltransferase